MKTYWVKGLISVFLLYHLAAVIVLPNSSSLVGRKLGWLFIPYANPFGLNTTWQFFSPGPAPMYHLEYEIEREDGSLDAETHQYPPARKATFNDGYNRRLYAMRFFSLGDEKTRKYLIPFLCRIHPEATAVILQSIVKPVPDIERAGKFRSYEDAAQRQALPRQTYDCNETEDISIDPFDEEAQ